MTLCTSCKNNDVCIVTNMDAIRGDCIYYTPKTNADRIRAMSDEELAEFIGGIYTLERDAWGDYDPCVVVEQSVKIRDKEDMLDWLKSPAGGTE